jgi:pimeloyl-ACP methyl ester carboxylesterase
VLVLIHAGIACSRMWEGQLAAFARRYRVIRYDMRGFGRTEMIEGVYDHHRDLRGLLDSLGAERALLVGCSIGGRTAIDFALKYPGGVRVLVGSAFVGAEAWGDPPSSGRSFSPQIMPATSAGSLS